MPPPPKMRVPVMHSRHGQTGYVGDVELFEKERAGAVNKARKRRPQNKARKRRPQNKGTA